MYISECNYLVLMHKRVRLIWQLAQDFACMGKQACTLLVCTFTEVVLVYLQDSCIDAALLWSVCMFNFLHIACMIVSSSLVVGSLTYVNSSFWLVTDRASDYHLTSIFNCSHCRFIKTVIYTVSGSRYIYRLQAKIMLLNMPLCYAVDIRPFTM